MSGKFLFSVLNDKKKPIKHCKQQIFEEIETEKCKCIDVRVSTHKYAKWLQCGQAVLACHKVTASLSSLSIGWGKKFLHHSTLFKKFSKKKKNSSININPNSPTFVFCLVISPLWAYKTRYQQDLKLNLWWQEKSNSIIFNHLNQSDIQGIKTISKM